MVVLGRHCSSLSVHGPAFSSGHGLLASPNGAIPAPVAAFPSSVFDWPVFWRLRLRQLGSVFPFSFGSPAALVTNLPTAPAFYLAAI